MSRKSTFSKQQEVDSQTEVQYRINKTNWQIIPLGGLVAVCIYTFLSRLNGLGYLSTSPGFIVWEPSAGALLIVIFGSIYIYRMLLGKAVSIVATSVAYVFSIIAILLFAFASTRPGGDFYFVFFILFFNAFVLPLWIFLGGIGLIALLIRDGK